MSKVSSQPTDAERQQESLEERLAALEEGLNELEQTQKVIRETTIKPRIENLRERAEAAEAERDELQAAVDAMKETISELRSELESIAGLADDQESNPDKRASDIRHVLIRRAKATDEGVARMYWKEIQDSLADLGHGDVARPQCYDVIDALKDQPGFSETKKNSHSGNRVKAIRLDLDALHADAACIDRKTQNQCGSAKSAETEVNE
jgi:DNA repair exonuclease SbcCD ATPase subunit